MESLDWNETTVPPAAFDEGDLQSTFHQPGVLDQQVWVALRARWLDLEGEEGLVSENEHRFEKGCNIVILFL